MSHGKDECNVIIEPGKCVINLDENAVYISINSYHKCDKYIKRALEKAEKNYYITIDPYGFGSKLFIYKYGDVVDSITISSMYSDNQERQKYDDISKIMHKKKFIKLKLRVVDDISNYYCN